MESQIEEEELIMIYASDFTEYKLSEVAAYVINRENVERHVNKVMNIIFIKGEIKKCIAKTLL